MPYPYDFSFDPMFLPILAALVLGVAIQGLTRARFNKYSRVAASAGLTGAQVAEQLLERAGIGDVMVERARSGALSDHYDPRSGVLMLSADVYDSTSVAALSVAAHETGHAIQHFNQYAPLRVRNAILPAVSVANQLVWLIFIAGIFFSITGLIQAGIVCFAVTVIFHLITLPVEFNASSIGIQALETGGYLRREEVPGARKVLSAAATTYVVAALMSILQLAQLVGIANRRGGRRGS